MTTLPTDSANSAPRCLTNTLDHLPEPKRLQLQAITERLCAAVALDWVVLFGSYARGDWVEDPLHGYFSDYDLLVVVSDPAQVRQYGLWERVEQELQAIAGRVPVTLLIHSLKEVNHEIRMGQYFFCDIINEGVVLHNAHRSLFARVKDQTPEERLGRGLHNFHYWFNSASDFWRGSGYYMAQGKNAPAAFMLHQSVERFYHALTLIYSGYKHKAHNLSKLAEVGESMHEALLDALPRGEEADKARFDLLKRAYIDARYSKSYRISEEELTVLRAQVLDLAERVLLACREKLASFCGAEAVGELPAVPEDGEAPELPPLPEVEDRAAMEDWGRRVATAQWESGREMGTAEGRERGLSEGLERGRTEGKEQGLAEGKEQGLTEGRERGFAEGVRKVAVALLAKGMATEAVAEATGLSVEEIGAVESGLAVGSDGKPDRGF